jgi:hypothetical protein
MYVESSYIDMAEYMRVKVGRKSCEGASYKGATISLLRNRLGD